MCSRPNCYEKEVYSRGETTTHVVYTYLGKTSSFFFLLHPDLVHMVESGRVMAVSLVPVPVKKTFFSLEFNEKLFGHVYLN